MRDRDAMDNEGSAATPLAAESPPTPLESKRMAARRRFMRMGAGGAAGLMVTVVHKRAFAGAKKTSVQSLCGSLQGTPDFIKNNKNAGVTSKKITLSAMGTPKGLVCTNPSPGSYTSREKEVDFRAAQYSNLTEINKGDKWYTYKEDIVKQGTGDLNSTLIKGNEWRLLEKGWCPIKVEGGRVFVEPGHIYYKKGDWNGGVNPTNPQTCSS